MIAALEGHGSRPGGRQSHPGHGPMSNLDHVRTYIKMLKDTRENGEPPASKRRQLDQMKKDKILEYP